jgi:hypothetical protein
MKSGTFSPIKGHLGWCSSGRGGVGERGWHLLTGGAAREGLGWRSGFGWACGFAGVSGGGGGGEMGIAVSRVARWEGGGGM